MPEPQKIVGSYFSDNPSVLIVNEIGALGSHLADSLLALGCRLYYFGNKKKDKIDHLLGKNNFETIQNLNQIYEITSLNYAFYLSGPEGKLLGEVVEKIKGRKTKFLFTYSGKIETAKKLVEELANSGIDTRVGWHREIYGPRIEEGLFSRAIIDLLNNGKMEIFQDESELIPLVFSADFIKGLNRAMFSPDTSGKVLNLSGAPVSFLNFLSEIEKKTKTPPQVVFTKKEAGPVEEPIIEEQENFGWFPETNLAEGISKTIAWFERNKHQIFPERKKSRFSFRLPSASGSFKKKFIFGLSIFFFLNFFFFLFPLFIFLINFSWFKKSFTQGYQDWQKGNWDLATQDFGKGLSRLSQTQKFFNLAAPFYNLIGLDSAIDETERTLDIFTNLLNSGNSYLEVQSQIGQLFGLLFKGEKVDWRSKVDQINQDLETTYLNLSLIWSEVRNEEIGQISKWLKMDPYLVEVKAEIPGFRKTVVKLKSIFSQLPLIVGQARKSTYLVVFQNNLELRPTGGLIGSFGVLTFEDGQLIDFEIQDVSYADDNLRGQVEPPSPIKLFLGEENWYLKDANWDPDFLLTAGRIEWFFEKETGRVVDGVIAVNLNLAQRLLGVTGEIELSDLQERINAQNLLEKAAYYSNSETFPGGGKRPDFQRLLVKSIFEKLKTADEGLMINFLKVVAGSLEEKDLLLNFHQTSVFELVKTFNWDGAIPQSYLCPNEIENCLEDYLFINEANFGKNRVNFFLKRMFEPSAVLNKDGWLDHTLKIYYQNLSLSEAWPGGRYKNYLRILVPNQAKLESVMLNDPADPSFWVQLPSEKIEVSTHSGKLSLGFLVEIPAKASRTIEIKYRLPILNQISKQFSYLLYLQKQPGTSKTPSSFTFTFPEQFYPMKILPKGTVLKNKVLINDSLEQDKVFRIDFKH